MHLPDTPRTDTAPEAVGPLPPAHWTVLILCDVLHWPTADAAALLGATRADLVTALRQARAAVRRGQAPGPDARAALSRLVGTTDARVLSLTGALLREHAPQVVRCA